MTDARQVLDVLLAGNRRFVARKPERSPAAGPTDVAPDSQAPSAIILGCSDSRVPLELVFDQGLGDLFVIRIAGNIVAPSQVASVEFAAEKFGTRLVMVLGHSHCGAVAATLEHLQTAGPQAHAGNLDSIVRRVRPAVRTLLDTPLKDDPEALLHHAVRANVRASVDSLRHGSAILERLADDDGLLVVGAEYDIASGVVDVFDGVGG